MMEWLLIFVGGLLGSSHCVGMCGGFVLILATGAPTTTATLLCRQVLYGLGRVFSYGVMGAMAGFCGWRLSTSVAAMVPFQAWLSILAGTLLLWQGLKTLGWVRVPWQHRPRQSCLAGPFFGAMLQASRRRSVFLAGMVNGWLPCGLVYAYLALAASTHDLAAGALTMTLFGLGTIPILALVGLGGHWLGLAARRRLLVVAAWCVVLTGVLSIGRGIAFLDMPPDNGGNDAAPPCPFCETAT